MGIPSRARIPYPFWRQVAAFALCSWSTLGCAVPLADGLDETTASEIVVALTESHIGANKERDPDAEGAYRVTVPGDDVAIALTTLRNAGLPRRASPGVLESLGEAGLVPSKSSERARWLIGTAGEVERSLQAVSGVLSARVHLAVPEANPLSAEPKQQPSASVLVRHTGATPPLGLGDVQRLVSGAVSGLAEDQVAVILHPVVTTPVNTEARLVQLGPLSCAKSSATTLRSAIGAVLILNLVLVLALVALWSGLRKARRELAQSKTDSLHPQSESPP